MNLAALPLHCLIQQQQQQEQCDGEPSTLLSSPYSCPLLWMMDCVMTGISSILLVQGALQILLLQRQQHQKRQQKGDDNILRHGQNEDDIIIIVETVWKRFSLTALVFAIVAGRFIDFSFVQALTGHYTVGKNWYGGGDDIRKRSDATWLQELLLWKEPIWVEWTYIVPIAAAVIACPPAVARSVVLAMRELQTKQQQQRREQSHNENNNNQHRLVKYYHLLKLLGVVTVMLFGLIVGAMGVLCTDWFCRHIVAVDTTSASLPSSSFSQSTRQSSGFADALSAPSLVFAGCDIAFVGLHLWLLLVLEDEDEQRQLRSQHGSNKLSASKALDRTAPSRKSREKFE